MRPGDVTGQGVDGAWFAVPAVMPADADNDADGTAAPAAPVQQAPGAAAPPAATAPPTIRPAFDDRDGDNSGGPNDGDGNG